MKEFFFFFFFGGGGEGARLATEYRKRTKAAEIFLTPTLTLCLFYMWPDYSVYFLCLLLLSSKG